MTDLRPGNQPVSTIGATFTSTVTATSLPEQPVASTAITHASVEYDLRLAADLLQQGNQVAPSAPSADARKPGMQKVRRRDDRDENAPRPPLTGYIRFLNEQREKMRKEQPEIPFAEVTKILGHRWTELQQEEKEQYRSEAQQDKLAYTKELAAYKQTEAYTSFVQKKALIQKQQSEGRNENPGFSLPIFTDEFLDYNKGKDLELQALRRANAEAEEKNNMLSDHILHLKKVVAQLEQEADQRLASNQIVEKKLTLLRQTVITKFSQMPIPESGMLPQVSTVDVYMARIQRMIMEGQSSHHEAFMQKVKDIMCTINLEEMFKEVAPEQRQQQQPQMKMDMSQ